MRQCGWSGPGNGFAWVNATTFSIVTVEDGLIIRLDEYLERAEALEAVGLSDAHTDS